MKLTIDTVLTKTEFSGRSYNLQPDKIQGHVEGQEALRQAIQKRLQTQQFDCPLYSFFYGVDWRSLIGQEEGYVRPELIRMVRETLARDDRILEVDNFSFEFVGNTCRCVFDVQSIYGKIRESTEVSI